jgi:HK97 family phage portal protein
MRFKYGERDLLSLNNPFKALSINRSSVEQADGGGTDIIRPNRISWSAEAGDPLQSSIVMACLMWMQRKFPESPMTMKRQNSDGADDILSIHPMMDLIETPNPWYDGTLLWMATVMDYTLDGNAYWVKARSEAGGPVELWWVPTSTMEPRHSRKDQTVFISHYEQMVNGRKIQWNSDDVVHFRFGMDPRNPRKGMSPLNALFREIFTDNEAAEFTGSLLRNSGVPGVIFVPDTDGGLTPDQQLQTERALARKMHGQNRGSALVASGKAHIEQFGFNPDQMDLGTIRNIPEERITAVMGIPASVVGLGTGLEQTKVGATQQEARRMAHENAIQPVQRIAAGVLKRQLLRDFEGEMAAKRINVGFDNSKISALADDQTQVVTRLNMGVSGGWVLVSEARSAMNLPVQDSDRVYLRSFSQVELPMGESMADQGGDPDPVPLDDDEAKLRALIDG